MRRLLHQKNKSAGDISLLMRVQKGDADAFAFLVRRHAERAYRIAYRFTANRQEAEDIVQASFLKLWEQPERWQQGRGATFSTWFTRIIINRCLDSKRSRSYVPLEMAYQLTADDMPADEAVSLQRQRQQLELAILELPDRQRIALNLCFYEEYSNKEAAAIMEIPVKAVQSLLMRAKTSLKDRVEGDNHA